VGIATPLGGPDWWDVTDGPAFDSAHHDVVQDAGRRFRTKCGRASRRGPRGIGGAYPARSSMSRDSYKGYHVPSYTGPICVRGAGVMLVLKRIIGIQAYGLCEALQAMR